MVNAVNNRRCIIISDQSIYIFLHLHKNNIDNTLKRHSSRTQIQYVSDLTNRSKILSEKRLKINKTHKNTLNMGILVSPRPISRCYLKDVQHPSRKIPLTPNTKVTIGRRDLCPPNDQEAPLKQLQLMANVFYRRLYVKVVGKGKTVANGKLLQRGCEYVLHDCTVLEIIAGKHYYVVRFKEEHTRKTMKKPYRPKVTTRKKTAKEQRRERNWICQKCRNEVLKTKRS